MATGPGHEAKWAEREEREGGFQTIELGGSGGKTTTAPEEEGHATASSSQALPPMRSFRSGTHKARRLEWNVQDYTVKLRRKRTLNILRDIVGRAEAGTLSAIIGPSGCGKTSLLDCIALRNKTFTGTLRLDGRPLTGAYFLDTAYVHQKELFFSHLTVREHLTFHAINRMARLNSREECLGRVDEVMMEVDLARVAESQIGGGELYVSKGLSGGERKRLNIATELLADPSTILMDEPTSGLDSVMGELICLLLQTLAARPPQRIIITAIHSPSSRLFMLFTHVTLLTSNGRLAYWGRRDEMTAFFERLGYVCPPRFNPADFALELASTKVIQAHSNRTLRVGEDEEGAADDEAAAVHHKPGAPPPEATAEVLEQHGDIAFLVRSNSSPRLVEACARHIVQRQFDADLLSADNKHKGVLGVKGAKASFATLFRTNLWRAWTQESREKMGLAVRLVMNVLLGLVFGLLYYRQIPHDTGRNTAGFLFALLTTLLIASSIQVCLHFPFDFAILMREYYAGANTPAPYFLGRTMSSLPGSLLFLLMGLIPYFMTGLSHDWQAVLYFCLIIFLMNLAAQSLGYLSSSFSSNPIVGLSILPLIITPMILFSGMLYERRSVPRGLRWIQDISVMNYGFAALVLNQIDKAGGNVQKFLTEFLQVHAHQFHIFIVDLAILAVVYRFLAMCVLLLRVRFISKEH